MLVRLIITGLPLAGTLSHNAFPIGTNGSNITAVPALPANFKKSKGDIFCELEISHRGILYHVLFIHYKS